MKIGAPSGVTETSHSVKSTLKAWKFASDLISLFRIDFKFNLPSTELLTVGGKREYKLEQTREGQFKTRRGSHQSCHWGQYTFINGRLHPDLNNRIKLSVLWT